MTEDGETPCVRRIAANSRLSAHHEICTICQLMECARVITCGVWRNMEL
jgi:hypothetical protein